MAQTRPKVIQYYNLNCENQNTNIIKKRQKYEPKKTEFILKNKRTKCHNFK